jgi:hypothetical protein
MFVQVTAGEERKRRKLFRIPLLSQIFLRQRVNPRIASGMARGEDASPLFM